MCGRKVGFSRGACDDTDAFNFSSKALCFAQNELGFGNPVSSLRGVVSSVFIPIVMLYRSLKRTKWRQLARQTVRVTALFITFRCHKPLPRRLFRFDRSLSSAGALATNCY